MRRLALLPECSFAVLAVLSITLSGCSTARAPRSQSDPDIVKLAGFWHPELLYILPSPCSRLYVEVDAVEGCQPTDATLNKLREFLATYCQKPDGIEIVRSDVIPEVTARGVPLQALARKFMNGPPQNAAATNTAYLDILYYDPALCDKPAVAERETQTVKTRAHRKPTIRNPHVDPLPYPPVMFINPRYGPEYIQAEFLIHEAGHELGLAGRATNAFAFHCLDKDCLMNWTARYRVSRLLLGKHAIKERLLCPVCIAQLRESARQTPATNLHFVGQVLVRAETNYAVLSLPGRIKIIVGDLTEQDCRDFAAAVRDEKGSVDSGEFRVDALVKDELADKSAIIAEALNRAKADPLEPVATVAPRIFAEFYANHDQFTNAVSLCRETVASNPKDYWSYNLLAWIKATCPDASVRDGKEAVSAATKACELTKWKEGGLIDTLAAAHAESGDFKRAIELQERAIHAGNAPESEEKEMQERLRLYKESQPYRDKPRWDKKV